MAALGFSTLLAEQGVELRRTRLLRHADTRSGRGRTVYALWRDDRAAFERYQSVQSVRNRSRFAEADHWATFVVAPEGRTLFAGLYDVRWRGPLAEPHLNPLDATLEAAEENDGYDMTRSKLLDGHVGLLCIEWGAGALSWIQRAEKHDKLIVELLRKFEEREFPGYARFSEPLSRIPNLSEAWRTALSSVGGVYLLTCPRDGSQYVGAAYGEGGFLQRWLRHAETGGDAVRLQARPRSDYQVSILEVMPVIADLRQVIAGESAWKEKLGTRAHGLTAN